MEEIDNYIAAVENEDHRKRTKEVFEWIKAHYPHLDEVFKWRQPTFTDHGTFIISLDVTQKHLGICPEKRGIQVFADEIRNRGFEHGSMMIKFPWKQPMDYELLASLIDYNVEDKKDTETYWRK